MYKQVFDPVGDSLGLSSIFAAIPIVVLFVLLGGIKMKAHWAALIALASAIIVAIAVYGMPVGQAFDSAAEGAAFGLFPIMYIVIVALWIYNMTVETGHFAVLRRAFNRVSDDQRVQAVIIAFAFGALLEALAGFGTPVAITAVMLIAVGFEPIKAAAVALVANTAPGRVRRDRDPDRDAQRDHRPAEGRPRRDGRPPDADARAHRAADPRRHGRRRPRHPLGVAGGGRRRPRLRHRPVRVLELHLRRADRHRRLAAVRRRDRRAAAGLAAVGPAARRDRRRPRRRPAIAGAAVADAVHEREVQRKEGKGRDSRGEVFAAFAPYLLIIVVFSIAQIGGGQDLPHGPRHRFRLARAERREPATARRRPRRTSSSAGRTPPGTLLLVAGLLTMPVLHFGPGRAVRTFGRTLSELKWAILTVVTVLALAYVMNLSGQTITLGQWIAGASGLLPFLSSDHRLAGRGGDRLGHVIELAVRHAPGGGGREGRLLPTSCSPRRTRPAACSGKMISPQNLAIGAAAVGLGGREGDIFRKVLGWSIVLVLLMCVIVYLQSTARARLDGRRGRSERRAGAGPDP